jgi:hypothetical protein
VDGTGNSVVFDIVNNFSTVNGGTSTSVTVSDLRSDLEPTGAVVYIPFMTFNLDPWTVVLTELSGGSDGTAGWTGAPVSGQTCTPAGSPFSEQNTFWDVWAWVMGLVIRLG